MNTKNNIIINYIKTDEYTILIIITNTCFSVPLQKISE